MIGLNHTLNFKNFLVGLMKGVYLAVFKTFEYLYLGGGGQDVSLYPDDCGRINHTSKLCPSGRCSDIHRTTNYL